MSHDAHSHHTHNGHGDHGEDSHGGAKSPVWFLTFCVVGGIVFVLGTQYLLPLIWLGLTIIALGFVLFYFR